jgi:hypothetical protein
MERVGICAAADFAVALATVKRHKQFSHDEITGDTRERNLVDDQLAPLSK